MVVKPNYQSTDFAFVKIGAFLLRTVIVHLQKIVQNLFSYVIMVKKVERGILMTEKILLLPGANGTELTRMLARFHKNSLGLRIMNAAELARFALMRSGIVPVISLLTCGRVRLSYVHECFCQ